MLLHIFILPHFCSFFLIVVFSVPVLLYSMSQFVFINLPLSCLPLYPTLYFFINSCVSPLHLVLCLLHLSPLLFSQAHQFPIPHLLSLPLFLPHFAAAILNTNTHLDLSSLPHSPIGKLCFSVLIGPVFLLFHVFISKFFHG